jgi:hypothetical protein
MNTHNPLRAAAAFGASVAAVMLMHYTPAVAREAAPELPSRVLEQAGAYSLYMRTASEISPKFTGGPMVAESVRAGASYEPKQLARGAVAFAAVVALQDRTFTRSVEQAAADPERRRQIAARLLANPYYVGAFPGADRAASSAASALGGQGERMRNVGLRVKQSAYDVQHQAWSKADVTGRAARLAEAKALSAKPLEGDEHDVALALSALRDQRRLRVGVSMEQPRMSSVVARGLALAALAVLGEADGANAAAVEQLMTDPECNTCLRMSKLNLFQCLSVSKPWYEDVFCLGQHVLIDTGECVQAASGEARRSLAYMPVTPRRREDRLMQFAGL